MTAKAVTLAIIVDALRAMTDASRTKAEQERDARKLRYLPHNRSAWTAQEVADYLHAPVKAVRPLMRHDGVKQGLLDRSAYGTYSVIDPVQVEKQRAAKQERIAMRRRVARILRERGMSYADAAYLTEVDSRWYDVLVILATPGAFFTGRERDDGGYNLPLDHPDDVEHWHATHEIVGNRTGKVFPVMMLPDGSLITQERWDAGLIPEWRVKDGGYIEYSFMSTDGAFTLREVKP